MTKPNCTAVGTVLRVAQVPASERAKPYTAVDIEMAPEERSGKGYRMRVSIRVAGECPSACVQGALVSISGPGSLTTFEHNGKWYPKLTIYGRPEVIGAGGNFNAVGESEPVPRPQKSERIPTAPLLEKNDDEDSVPF